MVARIGQAFAHLRSNSDYEMKFAKLFVIAAICQD
jgi:hypothetical protein